MNLSRLPPTVVFDSAWKGRDFILHGVIGWLVMHAYVAICPCVHFVVQQRGTYYIHCGCVPYIQSVECRVQREIQRFLGT